MKSIPAETAPQIINMSDLEWQNVGKPGLYTKSARVNLDSGEFLGLLRFDPDTVSGVHRHLDIAATYILAGCVSDYSGTFRQGDVGINPAGDTHDAFSYEGSVMVSRIEGATIYPKSTAQFEELKALHPGAYRDEFGEIESSRKKEVLPFAVEDEPLVATGCPGVDYRLIFDYKTTAYDYRMSAVYFKPGAKLPNFVTDKKLEIFVVAGDIHCPTGQATANHFLIIPANTKLHLESHFGCHLLAWSDAPIRWQDEDAGIVDPFGF